MILGQLRMRARQAKNAPKDIENHHESSFITRPERCLVEALSKCGRASAQASALLEPEKGF